MRCFGMNEDNRGDRIFEYIMIGTMFLAIPCFLLAVYFGMF